MKTNNNEDKQEKLKNKRYWIWFSLITEFGNVKKQKLLKEYKTPKNIYI